MTAQWILNLTSDERDYCLEKNFRFVKEIHESYNDPDYTIEDAREAYVRNCAPRRNEEYRLADVAFEEKHALHTPRKYLQCPQCNEYARTTGP